MENDWDISAWVSSIHHTMRVPSPPDEILHRCKEKLQRDTRNIILLPYHPRFWATRAETLYKLRYPNLAASDAYKALLLLDAAIDRKDDLGEKVWLEGGFHGWLHGPEECHWLDVENIEATHSFVLKYLHFCRREAYGVLLNSLDTMAAYQDMITISTQAISLYPTNPDLPTFLDKGKSEYTYRTRYLITEFKVTGEALWNSSKLGQVASVSYPWAPKNMMIRTRQVIAAANNLVMQASENKLEIRNANLGFQSGQASLGVFATRNIRAGELLYDSTGPSGISARQSTDCCYNCFLSLQNIQTFTIPCCPTIRYCSPKCVSVAKEFYHQALCGKDFSDLYSDFQNSNAKYVSTPAFLTIGWLRYLAIAVNSKQHPLECQFYAQLTAQYGANKPAISWSLESNVSGPLKVLRRLGVNVFEDLRFDAWVLETLRERTRTNAFAANDSSPTPISCPFVDSIYSFHNHTCDTKPMVDQEIGESARCLFRAARNIKKEEEVFVSYIGNLEGLNKEKRDEALAGWLAGNCACLRCTREGDEGRRCV